MRRWQVLQDLGTRSGPFECGRYWRRRSAERRAARLRLTQPGRFTVTRVSSRPTRTRESEPPDAERLPQ